MNRRERRKEETRTAILLAALTMIKEHGIYGTRIEDITEKCDVGKGVFYNYFDSKDAMVAELIDQGVRLLERDYLQKSAASPDLEETIANLACQHEAFFCEHTEYTLLFHQARGMMLLNRGSEPRLQKAFRDYLTLLGDRISAPASPATPVDSESLDLATALAGALTGNHTFRIAAGLPANSAIVVKMVSEGLGKVLRERRESGSRTGLEASEASADRER